MDDTTRVVNPAWRRLDSDIRKRANRLNRLKLKLRSLSVPSDLDPQRTEDYLQQLRERTHEIEVQEQELQQRKEERKKTSKHIQAGELPEEDRFEQLATRSKPFIDTIKIIAYRAESSMAGILREHLHRHHRDEARALAREIYATEANLIPDERAQTLTVELHGMATPKANQIITKLREELNATETKYPGTDLRLIFKSVSG